MSKLLDIWTGIHSALLVVTIQGYGVKTVRILLIIIGLTLAGQIGNRLVGGLMRPGRIPGVWDERRAKTLLGVIKSMLRYALYFVGIIMILHELGIDTTSVLAGVGIAGLAIGIGAQNLVRDVATGFFILFEDQFSVGDYVSISGVTGTVEELGLRATKIRAMTGDLYIISNGEIRQVARLAHRGDEDDTSGAIQPG